MRFDPEIDGGLVVLVGHQAAVNSVAINQEREAALLGEGTKFSPSEYGMGCVQKYMLELRGPWLKSIVEDFDAPDLVIFQRHAYGLMDLPMRHLTFSRLVKQTASVTNSAQRGKRPYTICSCSSMTPRTIS